MNIKETVAAIIKGAKEKGGIRNVYLTACGGSYGAFYPTKTFLEKESKDIRVGLYTSNEFVHNTPRAFGEGSLLIVTSHKGNTPETIECAKMGQKAGVPVIGLTWLTDSELTKHCDYVFQYTFGDDKDIAFEKPVVALLIVAELLRQTEGYANYDKLLDGVSKIDRIVKSAREQVKDRALAFAQEYKTDKVIYTMGSGAGFGAAYMQSICIFLEMQWINSAAIHAGEFFHGPFEITDATIPFLIQMSEGPTRYLDERALKFLKTYGRRLEVVDAKELGMSTIDADVVDYLNHSLFNNVYPVYNKALADARQHPLTTRRYMWKVDY